MRQFSTPVSLMQKTVSSPHKNFSSTHKKRQSVELMFFCVELTGFGVKRSGHIVMNLVGVELRQTRLGLIYSTLSWTTFDSKAWLIEPGVGPIRIDNP